jgi:hypothetical protein
LSGNGQDFPGRHHATVRETGMYVKVNDHFWQQTESAKVTKYGHKTIFMLRAGWQLTDIVLPYADCLPG